MVFALLLHVATQSNLLFNQHTALLISGKNHNPSTSFLKFFVSLLCVSLYKTFIIDRERSLFRGVEPS